MRPPVPLITLLPAGLLVAGVLLTGCGPPPALEEDPTGQPPRTPPAGSASPSLPSLPPGLPGTPSPGTYPEEIAISCDGQPGEDEVLAVLRGDGILEAGADAEVLEGPFCSGSWQYAVVSVPERDPLQVVTRGEPDALELVTAGTDVCTVEVRFQAPTGIQGAAAC